MKIFLRKMYCGSTGLQPASLRPKFVEFAAMRLDTRTLMVLSCLWPVMNAGFLFVGLAMIMKEVKGTRAVLSAILAISVRRVSLSFHFVSFELY